MKTLTQILQEIENKNNRELSDEYLQDHNCKTREDIGVGEYAYGITMIPCWWVEDYLKELQEFKAIFDTPQHAQQIYDEYKKHAKEQNTNMQNKDKYKDLYTTESKEYMAIIAGKELPIQPTQPMKKHTKRTRKT